MDLLRSESPYDDIIANLENGVDEVSKGFFKYKMRRNYLYAHRSEDTTEEEDEEYWKLVVPNDREVKRKLLHELHSVPYAGHPGYVQTLR